MADLDPFPRRSYWQSSSFKMAFLFTLLLGFGIGALGYAGYHTARDSYLDSIKQLQETERRFLSGLDTPQLVDLAAHAPAGRDYFFVMTNEDLPQRQMTQDHKYKAADFIVLPDGRRFAFSIDITEHTERYFFILRLCLFSIILMVAVAASSFLISFFVVSRTNRIAYTARHIMQTGNLAERIAVDSGWDDLSYMSRVLNEFLDRIEESLDGVRRVSDSIAHDLRTPLTRLRQGVEKLKKERDCSTTDDLVAEADQLLSTFNAVLRITRIESGDLRRGFAPVRLDTIMQDVADLYEPFAAEKKLHIETLLVPVTISGDRDLLFQAFANVMDNAIKFSGSGGEIRLESAMDEKGAVCRISDSGPGIPDTEKELVFKRFYRADHSRSLPGSGLGLSLVDAIVRAHEGQVILQDSLSGKGLVVEVVFPIVKNI